MGSNSKALLDLETNDNATGSSIPSLESKLQFCGKDNVFPQSGTKKLNPPGQRPNICPIPKSNVFGRVQDFLGVISESNKRLMQEAKDNPENYDIEILSGRESEYIEMDLMLGVADLHTPEAVAAAESVLDGHQPVITLPADKSSESESEDSSDDDENDHNNDVKGEKEEVGKHSEEFTFKGAEKDSSKESRNQKSRKRSKIVELS